MGKWWASEVGVSSWALAAWPEAGEISERDTPVKHLNVNIDTRVTWVCLKQDACFT